MTATAGSSCVSKQHLDRYIDEFAFCYNCREITDAERMVDALKKVGGKRLKYRDTKSED